MVLFIGGGNIENLFEIDKYKFNYSSGWYKYELRKLIENIDKIKEIFPNKQRLSANDIIKYIVYGENGPELIKNSLFTIEKLLRQIENKIKKGFWKEEGVVISDYLSTDIDKFKEALHDVSDVHTMLTHMYEHLYNAYIQYVEEDIDQTKIELDMKYNLRKPFSFNKSYDINDKSDIITMIKGLIPYMNEMELVHRDVGNSLGNDFVRPLYLFLESSK